MTTQPATTEPTFLSLEDLNYFTLPNGMHCFVGDVADIASHVENLGYQVYYALVNRKITWKDGNTTKTATEPTILKVVKNIVARTVTVATPSELGYETWETGASYNLPLIPYYLIQKMDDFFREVHDKHGTESIVILTYDPNYFGSADPSEGWGVLVPDQTNTAGDCDYVQESIAEFKEDHVFVVGSAHSHPEMSAFASGTDHKDQATFDGVHITYGWKKNTNGGATEYHIELQVAGQNWLLQPHQVFEAVPRYERSPDIDNWMEKVSKKSYNTQTVWSGSGSTGSTGAYSAGRGYGSSIGPSPKKKNAPAGCPNPDENIVIVELVEDNEPQCPMCGAIFIVADYAKRKCLACHSYLALPGESVEDVVNVRSQMNTYSYDIDPNTPHTKPVYVWRRTQAEGTFEQVAALNEQAAADAGKS